MDTTMDTTMLPRYDVARHAREGGYAVVARYGGEAIAARARQGILAKWVREIDPYGRLDPREMAQRLDARMRQQMAALTAARKAKAAARRAGLAEPVTSATLGTVCSWCRPNVAGKSHQTCERHGRTLDAMVAYVRARHAGEVA